MLLFSQAQAQPDSCMLTAHIKGLGNHRILFAYYPNDSTYTADTIRAHGGRFTFHKKLNEPTYYNLSTLREHPKMNRRYALTVPYIGRGGRLYGTFRDLLLENRTMTWEGSLRTFRRSRVTNAPQNDTMNMIAGIATYIWKNDPARQQWLKAMKGKKLNPDQQYTRDSLYTQVYKRQGDSIAAYIMAHPHTYASANSLWRVMYSDHAVKEAAFNALNPAFRHLANVSGYKKRLDRTATQVSVGEMAPEISLPDTSGREVALSSLRGKVTLVDFWASWCGPCRRENPNVVAAYKKYHPKGLEIYAVSLDRDKGHWTQAIEKDKLPWIQVSDLLQWESKAARAYGVQGIPNNFLLNKDGKVIATNLRGKTLEGKLKGLLK
jgi:thiol-disulfide isomerase/thioredoxin